MTSKLKGILGAAPAQIDKWNSLDWPTIRRSVERLQMRIAKAVKEKRWNKVKVLQRLLVTSRNAKLLAVKKVTTNKGKNTPGLDGIIWDTDKLKFFAVDSLKRRGYKAQPLRRIYIPKSNGDKRPLGIPIMRDRAFQALYALALAPIAETLADSHSYGFRPKRCIHDAVEQGFNILCRKVSPQWILEGDIKACFDQISHEWMLANIPMDKAVLQQWLQAGYVEEHLFNETKEGTPQGGIISPLLSNMVLDGLQTVIARVAPPKSKVNFVRYADDFICTGDNPEVLHKVVKPAIQSFLKERGLELSESKTHITNIKDGFDFLGFNFRKFKGKLITKPAQKGIKMFFQGLKKVARTLRYKKVDEVIRQLNAKLIGWTNNRRHVVSKRVFGRIDHLLFWIIRKELKRRHPKKSQHWINKTYYTSIDTDNWVFFGKEFRTLEERTHVLFKASACKIQRHIKIRAEANPFDPEHRSYLARRVKSYLVKRKKAAQNKRKLRTQWVISPKMIRSNNAGSS